MVSTGAGLIISLLFVGALYTTEATITGWSNPNSTDGAATPSIAEDIAVGAIGVSIAATAVGRVTYAIGTQPTAGKLTIDTTSGLLSLAAGNSFDFEHDHTYVFNVIATDGGDNATGTATVTLSITNVNEAPEFAPAQKSATVHDASTGGTSVTTVTATDVDVSDTITYTITGGNTNTDFAINGSTGAITVAKGKTIVANTLAAYTLIVTATDAGSLTATTTVSIVVKKAGDNSGDGTDTGTVPIVKESDPVFSASSFSPCIADKSPAGTTLTTITATVKDTSDTFTYAIASGDPGKNFTIDPNSGLIQVNVGKTLDKAATPSYSLVVTAADKVVTTKTGTATFSVTVADSCDSGTAVASVSVMMLIVSLFMTLF